MVGLRSPPERPSRRSGGERINLRVVLGHIPSGACGEVTLRTFVIVPPTVSHRRHRTSFQRLGSKFDTLVSYRHWPTPLDRE
jgi:hypothetical protein